MPEQDLDLHLLFHPRSVAIVGATNYAWGGGGLILKSVIMNGFPGKIYPVNPKEKELAGLRVYPYISQIPEEVDVAVVAIAARNVPEVIRECRRKGVRFVIIHSAGFGELNGEGQELEAEIARAIAGGGPRIIGGNSMGIYCPETSWSTLITEEIPRYGPGPVSFVGQSGWGTENFAYLGLERGLRFSKVVSIGNQSDLTIEDLIRHFAGDPKTRVIAGYVEGVKRAEEFHALLAEVAAEKPVVLWKGSRSRRSAPACISHTGSLAGDYRVFEAVLKQTGAIPVTGLKELVEVVAAFASPVLPRGNRVGLLVSSGGAGIACCDAVEAVGLELAVLPQKTQQELRDYLGTLTSLVPNVSNPVDVGWLPSWGSITPYLKSLQIIMDHVDMALLMCFRPLNEALLQSLQELRDSYKKPIVVIPGHSVQQKEGISLLTRNGLPAYAFPEDGVRALAALWEYAKKRLED